MTNICGPQSKKILKQQVDYSLTTAKQVIEEVPESDFKKMGGMKEFLDQVKNNIASSVSAYGFSDLSKAVLALQPANLNDLEEEAYSICDLR